MKANQIMRLTVALLAILVGVVPLQGQTKNKKARPKFSWVNPLSKKDQKLPGLRHATFQSPSLQKSVGYCVYLPKEYDTFPDRRFPVIYYLHGGRPGNERKSIKLVETIDQHIRSGSVAPMIYVFVNGGPVSHYNMPNDPQAQGADVFIRELIPHIDGSYRTIAERNSRGLEGFSQGGRGTARLMFRHPELFCSAAPGGGGHATEKKISENGGAESQYLKFAAGDNTWDLARSYVDKLEQTEGQKLKILVYVGDKGFNYQNNLEWTNFLTGLGVQHQRLIVPDVGHNAAEIYRRKGLEIMKFHAANFVK